MQILQETEELGSESPIRFHWFLNWRDDDKLHKQDGGTFSRFRFQGKSGRDLDFMLGSNCTSLRRSFHVLGGSDFADLFLMLLLIRVDVRLEADEFPDLFRSSFPLILQSRRQSGRRVNVVRTAREPRPEYQGRDGGDGSSSVCSCVCVDLLYLKMQLFPAKSETERKALEMTGTLLSVLIIN